MIATATVFVAAPAWAQAPTVDGKVYTTGDVTSEVSIHYSDFAGRPAISPPLDEAGNSVRAQNAIADVSAALVGNPYASTPR